MIRTLARIIVVVAALAVVVPGAWACGFARVDSMASDQALVASGDGMAALPHNPMVDCQGPGASKSDTAQTCVTLCAVTATMVPSISRQVAAVIGESHHPSESSVPQLAHSARALPPARVALPLWPGVCPVTGDLPPNPDRRTG